MSFYGRNLLPVLMIIVSVLAFFLFLRPHYATIKDLQAEKQEYERAVNNANEARALRSRLLATRDSFSPEDWKKLEILLPAKADGVGLARMVSSVASIFGISVDSFSFSGGGASSGAAASVPAVTPTSSGFGTSPEGGSSSAAPISFTDIEKQTMNLKVTFKARYQDFTSFVRALEKSLTLLHITDLSIMGNAPTGGTSGGSNKTVPSNGVYNFNLGIDTYWIQ